MALATASVLVSVYSVSVLTRRPVLASTADELLVVQALRRDWLQSILFVSWNLSSFLYQTPDVLTSWRRDVESSVVTGVGELQWALGLPGSALMLAGFLVSGRRQTAPGEQVSPLRRPRTGVAPQRATGG